MAAKFRFRWWYLLLLLPVLLYLAAHWYAGYRIDRAIAQANREGNSLTVGSYDYGFFPIAVTATGIDFAQDRSAFRASGTLRQVALRGLDLISVFTDQPITLQSIRVQGLDAELTRKASPAAGSDSSAFALQVSAVYLGDISLQLTDEQTGKRARVANLDGTLEPLGLPFLASELQRLQFTADSLAYQSPQDTITATASDIQYATEYAALQVDRLVYQQGTGTDVYANQLRLTGLDRLNFSDGISLDSLSAQQVGGGAQVQGQSRRDKPAQASATPATVKLGTLSLPDIDLTVSGAFGNAALDGALVVNDISYRDSLQLERLQLNGRQLSFSNQEGLSIAASDAVVEQGRLTLPLQPTTVGPTQLTVPELTLTSGTQTITVADLDYGSTEGTLVGSDLRISGDRITGTVATVSLSAIDRAALLAGDPITAGTAEISSAALTVHNRDGGSYGITAPSLTLSDIRNAEGLQIDRAQLTNGTLRRRGKSGKEDLVARGVYLDQYGIMTPFDPANLGPSKLRVDQVTILSEEEPIDYVFDRIAYTSRLGLLTLDSLQRRNRLTASETFRDKLSKSWLDFHFDGLEASGIDHDAMLGGKTIAVDSLTAADFRLLVVEDIGMEPESKQKLMPIEALRQIGPRIRLGAARLFSTDIAYGVVDTVLEAKTIHFTSGTIRIESLDTELSVTDSVRLSFDATFERTTPLHAEFALARDSSGRNYAIRGEFGQYDLSGINPLFEVAADAYIESGLIEGMQYRGRLQDEVLTGEMTMLYRRLDVTLVGGGSWFKNLLSGFVLKKDNLRGEEFRQGKIYHEHSRDRSFFNAYWKGLVSGMRSSALSDIALQKELD